MIKDMRIAVQPFLSEVYWMQILPGKPLPGKDIVKTAHKAFILSHNPNSKTPWTILRFAVGSLYEAVDSELKFHKEDLPNNCKIASQAWKKDIEVNAVLNYDLFGERGIEHSGAQAYAISSASEKLNKTYLNKSLSPQHTRNRRKLMRPNNGRPRLKLNSNKWRT